MRYKGIILQKFRKNNSMHTPLSCLQRLQQIEHARWPGNLQGGGNTHWGGGVGLGGGRENGEFFPKRGEEF